MIIVNLIIYCTSQRSRDYRTHLFILEKFNQYTLCIIFSVKRSKYNRRINRIDTKRENKKKEKKGRLIRINNKFKKIYQNLNLISIQYILYLH